MIMMDKIFVQIAAYRDPELLPTIRDCVQKASHPERLRFGICWQRSSDDTLAEFSNDPRFRIVSIPFRDSKGVCWARNLLQSMYNDEEYTLQLDSHHRFAEHWDTQLIEMLLCVSSPKPLLTSYVPAYDPETGSLLSHVPCTLAFDRFTAEGAACFRAALLQSYESLAGPVRARFYSAHFAFARGVFCQEVRHDPHLYFIGEEINITVRAFTHGYDLFHPHRTVIWHAYSRGERRKHWDDHVLGELCTTPWYVRDEASHRRNRILLGMEPGTYEFGEYGLGSSRTLAEYERYAGVNFRLRVVQQYTSDNLPPPNPESFSSDEEWLQRCCKQFSALIDVNDQDLPD